VIVNGGVVPLDNLEGCPENPHGNNCARFQSILSFSYMILLRLYYVHIA
jgi:hypothetical protein